MTDAEIRQAKIDASYETLERVIFVLLAILTVLRPLISEMFQIGEISILRPLHATISGPTPATTAALDSASCALALYVLVRRPGRGIGWGIFYVASVLLAAAVAISTLAADEKRIALNAGVSLLSSVLTLGALVMLTNTLGRQRLLLAAVLAGGIATAGQCLLDYGVYNPTTAAQWPAQKAHLVEMGYDPNTPMMVNFERRMLAGEVSAFQAHPNITASLLTMWALPLLALVIAGLVNRRASKYVPLVAALALIACAIGIILTGSIAGIVAAIGGTLLLLLIGAFRGWLARHGTLLVTGLITSYVALIAAGAGYGIAKGTLPHPSLEVRWFYWQAAAKTLPDAPLTGIGRENFRQAYQQHRPPTSTEEVSNPHDIWVTALVELGPLGLLASVMLFTLVLFAVARRLKPPASDEEEQTTVDWRAAPIEVVSVAGGLLLFWMLFSDTALQGENVGIQASTLLIWLIENALVWLIGFSAFMAITRGQQLPRVANWLVIGVLCAVMAAFVHNLVGFSLLLPCGLATLGGLIVVGVNLNRRQPEPLAETSSETPPDTPPQKRPRTYNLPAAITLFVTGAALVSLVAKPTSDADSDLRLMRGQLATAHDEAGAVIAFDTGWKAVKADPLDAYTPRIIAREILQFVGGNVGLMEGGLWWLRNAKDFSEASLARNPDSSATLKQYAIIHEYLELAYIVDGQLDTATEALKTSADTWIKAIDLFPTDLRGLVDGGVMLTKYWEETEDESYAAKAREYFNRARAINDGYRPDEPVRLLPSEMEKLEQYETELPEQLGSNDE